MVTRPGERIALGFDPDNVARLARELRYAGYEPTPVLLAEADLEHQCGRAAVVGEQYAAFVAALAGAWGEVKSSPEDNTLVWACDLAHMTWGRFRLPRPRRQGGEDRRRVMAAVYWLSVGAGRRGEEWFALPVVQTAERLGLHRNTLSKILKEFVGAGLIEFDGRWTAEELDRPGKRRQNWSYTEKQARRARLGERFELPGVG